MGVLNDLVEMLKQAPVMGEDDYRGSDLGEYDTVLYRAASATVFMGVAGTMLGDLKVRYDFQHPIKNRPLIKAMGRAYRRDYGLTFALIGFTYGLTDVLAERYRGKKDFVNSIYAGLVSGIAYGFRAGSIPRGLTAASTFAVATALVDASGNTTRRPTKKEFLPYPVDQ